MTEAEWLACEGSDRLLQHVSGRVSARKLRLLTVACLRSVPYHEVWATPTSLRSIDVAAQWAEGMPTEAEWEQVFAAAGGTAVQLDAVDGTRRVDGGDEPHELFAIACVQGLHPDARNAAAEVHRILASTEFHVYQGEWDYLGAVDQGRRRRSVLLDVVGNPFRPPQMNADRLARNEDTVPQLARAIYERGAFERLPILADALEDAGCTDTELLGHLRGPGPHVRGCWALDLVLGKS
jgi:hypothetical protein